eukprot:PhF_6_TR42098/c0_g1_i2/m.63546
MFSLSTCQRHEENQHLPSLPNSNTQVPRDPTVVDSGGQTESVNQSPTPPEEGLTDTMTLYRVVPPVLPHVTAIGYDDADSYIPKQAISDATFISNFSSGTFGEDRLHGTLGMSVDVMSSFTSCTPPPGHHLHPHGAETPQGGETPQEHYILQNRAPGEAQDFQELLDKKSKEHSTYTPVLLSPYSSVLAVGTEVSPPETHHHPSSSHTNHNLAVIHGGHTSSHPGNHMLIPYSGTAPRILHLSSSDEDKSTEVPSNTNRSHHNPFILGIVVVVKMSTFMTCRDLVRLSMVCRTVRKDLLNSPDTRCRKLLAQRQCEVRLTTLDDRECVFAVKMDDTLHDLKVTAARQFSVHPWEQIFVYDDRVRRCSDTVRDVVGCDVEYSTLQVVRNWGCAAPTTCEKCQDLQLRFSS